ncbi:MAG: type I CRISPR-associated protein Cas7, partial [Candidatus Heimdallarchaeota archaeon]|nr:type I CRISPR-associated protein Cas7 [Candidatus Heimdallarchaeota archaeon]
ITGPAQFGIGRSLNKPRVTTHTITATFSTGDSKQAGAFGETHVVEYSIIAFPGIISETTAKETNLTEEDLNTFWDGLWYGTKELNTRSKFNHNPRLLLSVVSKEKEFQIGGLSRLLRLDGENYSEIKSEEDVTIDIADFMSRLNQYKDNIDKIEIIEDDLINFSVDDTNINNLGDYLTQQGYMIDKILD